MSIARHGATFRQIETLMRVGAVAHLTDGELLGRFLDRRDGGEAAFEALVSRHGGMVLNVIRGVLGDLDGADDAFQAVFLVLVRQAGSIRKRDSLGPWLHGVARRVALRLRRDSLRRRDRERVSAFRVVGSEPPDEALADALHAEIARLPEKYRTPIVLCDLEGRTHAEAARTLDWPIGTVSGRLSRARALLRSRIARRGMALSAATGAIASGGGSAPAGVIAATVRAASAVLSGGLVPRSVAALAGAITASPATLLVKAAAGLVATAAMGWTGFVATLVPGTTSAPPPPAPAAASPAVDPILPGAPASVARRRRLDDERAIVAVALAPDGVTLASGSEDAVVTLWDLETGLEKATMLGHRAAVTALAFTRDGATLASVSDADRTTRLWDVATGRAKLTVTWLEPDEAPALELDPGPRGSGRGASGRDRCADGPARDGRPCGA